MSKQLTFSQKIIIWNKKYGINTLPWQIKKTPYKIWISEIMLQQTQVTRVMLYFQRFINTFPNIQILATAKLDTVLHIWSGLGYYARARNLYTTANIIVNEYYGFFPQTLQTLVQLPGIGRSTAGAILSLAFKQHYPILDSNVKRILTRYYTINGWPGSNTIQKKLWLIITKITPKKNTSQFNQGIMNLGETICTTTHPQCGICPLNNKCQAYINNVTNIYPNKKPKKISLQKTIWLLILQYKNTVWLERCPKEEIWGELFCAPRFKEEKKLYEWLLNHNLNYTECKQAPILQYKISCCHLQFIPFVLKINNTKLNIKNTKTGLWYDLYKPQIIGLPQPMIQLLIKLQTQSNSKH